MRGTSKGLVIGLVAISFAGTAGAQQFEGAFDFRWLPDRDGSHREMELLSDVAFVDQAGVRWAVPAQQRTDGASIPAALWSYAGSPFTGTYRRAAVIHDYFCRMGTHPALDVHNVFREGMLADGTWWLDALSKYSAVVVYDRTMSLFGEGCGIETRPVAALQNAAAMSPEQDLGVRIDEEVLDRLATYEEVPFAELPLYDRINEMADIAQIERRETYESLAVFRAMPIEENYLQIERAVASERPDLPQLDALIDLARATVPPRERDRLLF